MKERRSNTEGSYRAIFKGGPRDGQDEARTEFHPPNRIEVARPPASIGTEIAPEYDETVLVPLTQGYYEVTSRGWGLTGCIVAVEYSWVEG